MLGMLGWWVCCLGWMATVDWVGRDSIRYRVAPRMWVPTCTFVFLVTALVVWWIPSGIAAAVLVPLAWLVPGFAYVVTRNRGQPVGKRVLTANHFRNVASRLGKKLKLNIEPGLEDDEPPVPEVDILPAGQGDSGSDGKNVLAAMPGLRSAREIVMGAVLARATRAAIEPAGNGVQVRYEIDTVWQNRRTRMPPSRRGERDRYPVAPALSQEQGTAAMAVLRAAAGLAGDGHGMKPAGEFVLSVDGKRQTCRVLPKTAPVSHIQIEFPPAPAAKFKNLADLGMAKETAELIQGTLRLEKGLLLVAGPAGSGLTTTIDMVVQAADRLLRDFCSIEDQAAPAREIQNVKVQRFDGKSVQPTDALTAAMRDYPQAIVTRDIRDKALLAELVRLAGESQLVVVSLKAHDAIDAVHRLMQSGVPTELLAGTLIGAISVRLVRRLCPRCRTSGPPAADLLRRMQRRPEQVPTIWQAAVDGCSLCQGVGYLGRTGIFEFAPGGRLQRGIEAKAKPPVLRELAVKDGMIPLQAVGFAAAVEGATSMEEVDRVLAAGAAPTPVKGGASA